MPLAQEWPMYQSLHLYKRPKINVVFVLKGTVSDQRCRLSWLTNVALVYEPKCGGRGVELRGLCQWVQLYTEAQINLGDLTPYLTFVGVVDKKEMPLLQFVDFYYLSVGMTQVNLFVIKQNLCYSQSCWYFRPSFVNCCPSPFLSGLTLSPFP